jgi:thiol-disulfide isomerase/thioredoxin
MSRILLFYFLVTSLPLAVCTAAQNPPPVQSAPGRSDSVSQAIAQGDFYQSKRKYDLARDSYQQADKLAHHSSPLAYLKLASVERKLGDFSSALDNAKRAVKAAGSDKSYAVQGHLMRSTLLTQMSGKPTDNKLKEAESELREALTLDPSRTLAHFDLGFVLLKQGRDDDGAAELREYLAAPGADPETAAEAKRLIANPIRAREPFAADFSFTTAETGPISNVSLRGKVVMLDFWGSWCPACREAVPSLRSIQKKYAAKDFLLVGVSSDDDESVWRTFIQAQHMDWAEYLDSFGRVQKAFKIEAFPTYVVVDKDGVVRFRQAGFGPETQGDLEEVIGRCLKKAPDPKVSAAALAAEPAPTTSAPGAPAYAAPAAASNGASESDTPPALDELEVATVAGNIYRNPALGLSYQLPEDWKAATPQELHSANQRRESSAMASRLEQHPELAGRPQPALPKIVLYASRRGQGDGQRLSMPCVRIIAAPTRLTVINPTNFAAMVQNEATARQFSTTGAPSQFRVKEHEFLRADFEGSTSPRMLYSHIQTLAGGYLLNVELYAVSPEDFKRLVDSLQTISIEEK